MIAFRHIGLHLVYDGTYFHGYQIQPNQRTVQGELEAVLEKLLEHPCPTICAGRTDAKVHAYAQFINFKTSHQLPLDKFVPAVNRLLPKDITIIKSYELPEDFHARHSALARHYRYVISTASNYNPFARHYQWWEPRPFDRILFQNIWNTLAGEHNFEAFCKSGSYRKNYMIKVLWSRCQLKEDLILCDIMANSFLYNMIRTLVGTVVPMARGHFPQDHLTQLLKQPDRTSVGITAPPQGLYLYNVIYPSHYQIHLYGSAWADVEPMYYPIGG